MTTMRSNIARRENGIRAINRVSAQRCALPTSSASTQLGSTVGRMSFWWLVGLTLIWSAFLLATQSASAQSADAQSFRIYVPMVSTDETNPTGSGGDPETCGLNSEESAIAELMQNDSDQKRNQPVCDPILAQVARARARDMALRGYFSHTNPDGDGPNLLVRKAGYLLPDWYSDSQNSNNIESIGGGYTSASAAWQGWLGSPSHRMHVLGTQSFYADQQAYGVGYYFNADSPLQHYWVFLSAPVAD